MTQEQRARVAVARLELMPHGSTTTWDSATHGAPESKPPGAGVGREEGDYAQRSHLHFRRRLVKAHTEHAFRAIADDAEIAIDAWMRTPGNGDLALERTDPNGNFRFTFKRMIANSDESPTELARIYGVSRRTIYDWRERYRAPFRRPA